MRFSTLQNAFFLALLVLTTLAFLGLIQDFLLPIFWATVLAVFFRPLHERWFDMCGGRATLASVLTIATIIAAFFLVVWDMFAEEFGDAEDALETATDEITPAPAEAPPNDAA